MGLSEGLARALGRGMFCFWGILECQGPSSGLVGSGSTPVYSLDPDVFHLPPQAEKEERTVEAPPKLWSSGTRGPRMPGSLSLASPAGQLLGQGGFRLSKK